MNKFQSILLSILIIGFVITCKEKVEEKKVEQITNEAKPAPAPKESVFPYFKVDVILTPKALKKLKSTKSKIGLTFMFDNEGQPDSKDSISESVELSFPQVIATDTLNIPQEKFDKLKPGYEINVNAYSKGKESDLNFLHCDVLSGKLDKLLGGTHTINCDLLKL
ncbi:MAG: hypothetical protein SFU98_07210 [Leptospiraceae bacterium]|nr:hypothetical protein [Leptospiraceae bacterium]